MGQQAFTHPRVGAPLPPHLQEIGQGRFMVQQAPADDAVDAVGEVLPQEREDVLAPGLHVHASVGV